MTGRTGYQILNFGGITISSGSSVTVKGAFAKAKSGLPILINGADFGGVEAVGFTYDANIQTPTKAILPIIIHSGNTNVIASFEITADDSVTLVIS